ncbi:hypothetical protein I6F07_04310 [Ensifer sp. IC4062]|nr:hypothetical protein [Ensifer sp. IC4062]MCA1439454.1 hypothetical protein [Ensifer sp. IC4062]
MPANFDNMLTIDGHGCISPAGPLELREDEAALRLDVWVWQPGGACMAFLGGPFEGKRWAMNPDPHDDHFGDEFRPGPATAMGLMVTRKANGETTAFHWTEAILLKSGEERGSGAGHHSSAEERG